MNRRELSQSSVGPTFLHTGRSVLFPLMAAILIALAACSETNFKPPVVPPSARDTTRMRPIRVVYEGEQIHDKEWLRTFAVSRLFSHRATNRSGSFVDIVGPSVASALQGSDYIVDEKADDVLKIVLLERELQWYPPQEFIQTVRPHRRGRYLVHLKIQVTYANGQQWDFSRQVEGEAFPGEELPRIESVVEGLLGEFLWGMLDHLPPARRTVP